MENLVDICKEYSDKEGLGYFGIRSDDRDFSIGEALPASRIWDDGDPTEDELDGTSTIWLYDAYNDEFNVDALRIIKKVYAFRNTYLVASHSRTWGEDKGEWVLSDPVVVEVIK